MVEVYKALKALSPEFMHNLFETKETKYALRRKNLLTLPEANSVKYGLNSVKFRASIQWNSLPNDIKLSDSLSIFKKRIKTWKEIKCNCIMCR